MKLRRKLIGKLMKAERAVSSNPKLRWLKITIEPKVDRFPTSPDKLSLSAEYLGLLYSSAISPHTRVLHSVLELQLLKLLPAEKCGGSSRTPRNF